MTHDDLVARAERWLYSIGCSVVICDPFRACVETGEQPDAIGWRSGVSILVECKMSRADGLADAKKPFRRYPDRGMGDWRFWMVPVDIEYVPSPVRWGLLVVDPSGELTDEYGVPPNTGWGAAPFRANTRCETQLLVSALARRGQSPPTEGGSGDA